MFHSSSLGCSVHNIIDGLQVSGILNFRLIADAEDAIDTKSSDSLQGEYDGVPLETGVVRRDASCREVVGKVGA